MADDDKFPSQLADRFQLRLPPGLRGRIAARAKENGRSMNTELVDLIERAYPQTTPTPDLHKRAQKILDRIAKHIDEPLNEGVRWSLVSLINNADEYGVLETDTGIADLEAAARLEEATYLRNEKAAAARLRQAGSKDPEVSN